MQDAIFRIIVFFPSLSVSVQMQKWQQQSTHYSIQIRKIVFKSYIAASDIMKLNAFQLKTFE